MGRLRYATVVVLPLAVGCWRCHSFSPSVVKTPWVGRGSNPNRAATRFETRTSFVRCPAGDSAPSTRTTYRGAQRLQVLSSPDEVNSGNHDSSEVVDAPSGFNPTFLWWTKSREEENATLNLIMNAGIIASVVVFAVSLVLRVDMDVSRGWTATEFFARVPIDNWLGYSEVLRDKPILVKACTSGTVYALGDWTAQTVEGVGLADIKRGRVLRSALAGLLLHGPLSHVWYDVCEWVFDTIGWNDYWWVAAPKIVTDQIIWGPFWNAVYITFLGTLKKDSFDTIKTAVVTTAFPLVLAGIRLWPLAHVVTYGLVPTENRLLWVDFVEIIWVTILSTQAAEQAQKEEAG